MKRTTRQKRSRIWILSCTLTGVVCLAALSMIIYHFNNPGIQAANQSTLSQDDTAATDESSVGPSQTTQTFYVSNLVLEMSVTDLIEESNLVARCVFKEASDAFRIESTTGGIKHYTDYYFEVSEAYRGEIPDNGIITVRQEGGTVNGVTFEVETASDFEVDKSYLLFLYQPGMGGGFNTEGDYYYITGSFQGVYPLDSEERSLSDMATATFINEGNSNPVQLQSLQAEIEEINETIPADTNIAYQLTMDSLQENLESGMMTLEAYNEAVADAQVYATYASDPPAGYSGSEE